MSTLIMMVAVVHLAVCPPVGESDVVDNFDELAPWKWAKAPRMPAAFDGDPATFGAWDVARPWPTIAIHAAMLPTGRVLHYSYPGSGEYIWDPVADTFTEVDVDENLFCSGHSHLANGMIYVTGGNDNECQFQGIDTTYLFDPETQMWTFLETMEDGRWYPTNVTLGDGRVIITTGLDRTCETNVVMEMFTPGEGLSIVPEGERDVALYARMHLLSDGRIAHVGPERPMHTFELGEGWTPIGQSSQWRWQGTAVLLPGPDDRVLLLGGYQNDVASAAVDIIDLSGPEATGTAGPSLNHGRAHADALILPDQSVLVMGGGQDGLYESPVNTPELLLPGADAWLELPPHAYPRMYHATTVLLRDGRVLVAGQDSGDSAFWTEIYNPPYLYRGERPTIAKAPGLAVWGGSIDITTPDAASIDSVVLVKLSSVTHSVNFEQRLVDLAFTSGDESLTATITDNPNVAPPGVYMLFILNDSGVPSVAEMITVGPAPLGDLDGDGDIDAADLAVVLAAWGPCPACPADLDDDHQVGPGDLAIILANWTG